MGPFVGRDYLRDGPYGAAFWDGMHVAFNEIERKEVMRADRLGTFLIPLLNAAWKHGYAYAKSGKPTEVR
jgi:hypothetical protein